MILNTVRWTVTVTLLAWTAGKDSVQLMSTFSDWGGAGGTTEMRVERSDAEGRRKAPSSWVQENCPWIATSGSPQRQTSDLALMAPKVELQRREKCPSPVSEHLPCSS